ncbi:MAG: leucine-rich repeat domain-containing protein [Bacteroidaceae bacterium]|nr:leucine-rich repeat domain-containing protein [Bacteroidaceae bacterium]
MELGRNGYSKPLFSDCPLDSVFIGRKLNYNLESDYGYSPFYKNSTLRSVVITDVEKEITNEEFFGCTNLVNVRIGNGVTIIGAQAFSDCTNLEYFVFGHNVDSIGDNAFSNCTSLSIIRSFAFNPPSCGNLALNDINKQECILLVPQSSIADYQYANQWKDFFFIEVNEESPDGVIITSDRVIINVHDGQIEISGLKYGEVITAYQIDGRLITTCISNNGKVVINTGNIIGSQIIIRIRNRSKKIQLL